MRARGGSTSTACARLLGLLVDELCLFDYQAPAVHVDSIAEAPALYVETPGTRPECSQTRLSAGTLRSLVPISERRACSVASSSMRPSRSPRKGRTSR